MEKKRALNESREEAAARRLLPNSFHAALLLACMLALRIALIEASHGREEINYIGPERVRALLDGGEKITFIDIRPAKDFQEKRVAGARSLRLAELDKRLGEIPKAGRIIIYCNAKRAEKTTMLIYLAR